MLKNIFRLIAFLGCIVLVVVFGVRSCSAHEYPRPSEAYYVNDFSDVLLPSTERFIISEGESLYDDTKNIDEIGGAQIVFATFTVKDEASIANYDKNALFREWQIGKNDMGVLVILFFTEVVQDDMDYFDLKQVQIEVGYHMSPYLTTIDCTEIYDKTIGHYLPANQLTYAYDDALNMGVGSMENELLNICYGDVYDQPGKVISQNVFDPDYENYMANYSGTSDTGANASMNLILYFFSAFGSVTDKVLFSVFAILFTLVGGFAIGKAGGGSSGGAGLFKRR